MSVTAKSPNGTVWLLYASDETPTLTSVQNAPQALFERDTVYDDIHFLSTNKVAARRWLVDNDGNFSLHTVPVPYGRTEYVEFLTPAGVSWVVGIDDNGNLYTELFTSGSPKQRRVMTTVMHKGKLLWVADNRNPVPMR